MMDPNDYWKVGSAIFGLLILLYTVWYWLFNRTLAIGGWRFGLVFRPGSLWIGMHWSSYNRRLCINLVPMITFKIAAPGGIHVTPGADNMKTLREHVEDIEAERLECTCDLGNWQPQPDTGHSYVCKIRKEARRRWIQENVK